MTDSEPVTFSEIDVPTEGIEETIGELVELYGGEMQDMESGRRTFLLPLRRGVGSAGAVECTLSWDTSPGPAKVTFTCDRNVDAPRLQRVMMLSAGVVGALLFMAWPFVPRGGRYDSLAWIGGAIAIAVYLLSLRKTSGGLAADFLKRLARRQRELGES